MCGLIGIINKKWNKTLSVPTETIFKQLIYAGALRGFDATGVWKVTEDHKTEVVKDGCPAGWFLSQKPAVDFINFYYKDSIAVFAHNRKATVGAKNDKELAHPFKENDITLMHNGTLTYWPRTAENKSDSHYITRLLATENREFKPIESLSGAYALVWHNAEKKQINFCRNSERPLYIVEADDWLILVSEAEMGEWILLRNNHDVISTKEVDAGYIYKLSWKNGKLNLNKSKFTPKKAFAKATSYSMGTSYNGILEEEEDYYSYTPPKTTSTPIIAPIKTEYDTELTVIPDKAIKIMTVPGGHQKWTGFGVREERYEVTGKVIFPLKFLNEKFTFSIKADEWDSDLLDLQCVGIYHYRNAYNGIQLKDLYAMPAQLPFENKDEEEDVDPVGNPTKQEFIPKDDTWITTRNKFEINEENFDAIASCKCERCEADLDLSDVSNGVLLPLYQTLDGQQHQYGYKYICPDCISKKTNNVLTLPQKKQVPMILTPPFI